MKKIGILGEHPQNDAQALINLMEKSEKIDSKKYSFKIILKKLRGSQLETGKALKLLKKEFALEKFEFLIFVRDLDGLLSETKKIKARENWFKKFDQEGGNGKGLFYLAVYEMESIILADISTFNKNYSTKIKFNKNPLFEKDPKGFLKNKTYKNTNKQYQESHCPDLFSKLDLQTVLKKHKGERSFAEFLEKLENRLKE